MGYDTVQQQLKLQPPEWSNSGINTSLKWFQQKRNIRNFMEIGFTAFMFNQTALGLARLCLPNKLVTECNLWYVFDG